MDTLSITLSLEKPIPLSGNLEIDGNIFIYGKEVNDFHSLNKDYLFTINFAATQELDRQIQWHTAEIDKTISENATNVYGVSLKSEINTLRQEIQTLKNRVTYLESQIYG